MYVITIKLKTMTQYITLTWRKIETLEKPGFYHLPFYSDDHDVEVVYATPNDSDARMKVIIVKMDDGSYQDFYYNAEDEVFKPLTLSYDEEDLDGEENTTFAESWKNEDVGVDCPEEFANCIGHSEDIFDF